MNSAQFLRHCATRRIGKAAPRLNLEGARFGHVVAIRDAGMARHGERLWLCRCDCGTEFTRRVSLLNSSPLASCGCKRREVSIRARTTHGHTANNRVTPEYGIWVGMLRRCRARGGRAFVYYSGRGIRVCERWEKFENFLADMGPRPSPKHSLDRVDVNGDYAPTNCRWATSKEQARNKTSSRLLEFGGQTKTLAEWAEWAGLKRGSVIAQRLELGWPVGRAILSEAKNTNRDPGGHWMNIDNFIRRIAETTSALTDDERDGLANCIDREIRCVMRVRRLKAESATLPPPRETAGAEMREGET